MKLTLATLSDDKPLKLTVELPARVHRDLLAYAAALGRASAHPAPEPSRLIVAMIERFMSTDRDFAKIRRQSIGEGKVEPKITG